jgi:hypothetical protein
MRLQCSMVLNSRFTPFFTGSGIIRSKPIYKKTGPRQIGEIGKRAMQKLA